MNQEQVIDIYAKRLQKEVAAVLLGDFTYQLIKDQIFLHYKELLKTRIGRSYAEIEKNIFSHVSKELYDGLIGRGEGVEMTVEGMLSLLPETDLDIDLNHEFGGFLIGCASDKFLEAVERCAEGNILDIIIDYVDVMKELEFPAKKEDEKKTDNELYCKSRPQLRVIEPKLPVIDVSIIEETPDRKVYLTRDENKFIIVENKDKDILSIVGHMRTGKHEKLTDEDISKAKALGLAVSV